MNEYIDSLKLKLISAVDLNQKKINKLSDIKEALKELESFPMTLDILNTSRIGKIVNDIRHFNDAQSDIKARLKDLIKQWNDQLLPHHNKKSNKVSKTINSHKPSKPVKVSESTNAISHYNNENYKERHLLSSSKVKSLNNLDKINGKSKSIKNDCDNSFEIPSKRQRLDHKASYTETLLKENHYDADSCPSYKSNHHFIQKHDSPAPIYFADVKKYLKREEDNQSNSSPLLGKDKSRKRKHDLPVNGVAATPLQKVKSTRELLAGVTDRVGSDTKKKILCNEIAFEDDIPKSCIPESVRPKPKLVKQARNSQSVESSSRKYSPKVESNNDYDFMECPSSNRSVGEPMEQHIKLERNSSFNSLTDHKPSIINHTVKCSPFNPNGHSPAKDIKRTPQVDTHAQSVATPTLSDDLDKCSLKIKIPLKPYKKKSKVHHDPPITNRMDDMPALPDLKTIDWDSTSDGVANEPPIEFSEEIADLLAHSQWEGYNCTRHPISQDLNQFCDAYKVDHLIVLPWTDKVFECPSHFPLNTEFELNWLESTICEYS